MLEEMRKKLIEWGKKADERAGELMANGVPGWKVGNLLDEDRFELFNIFDSMREYGFLTYEQYVSLNQLSWDVVGDIKAERGLSL